MAQRIAEENERERAEREERNKAKWDRLCPPLYRDTDILRLPQKPFFDVMAWPYGSRGLVLYGKTGTGKTRMMFQLLRRLFDAEKSLRVYTASTFRTAVTAAQMDGSYERWLEGAALVDVFYFDDLGQMKLTETSEEALLAVIEARTAQCTPFLTTTQYTGDELAAQFLREQRGQATVRRLRDFCQTITV